MPKPPYNQPALFLAAALFALLLAILASTLRDASSLRTAAILNQPSPQQLSLTNLLNEEDTGPALISNRISFRATQSQAQALHTALQGSITTPPQPTGTPKPGSAAALAVPPRPLTAAKRVAAAKRAVPALRWLSFTDITAIVPSVVAQKELTHNINRWFTLTLPGQSQEVPITQADPNNPLAIEARAKTEQQPDLRQLNPAQPPSAALPPPPPDPAHIAAVAQLKNTANTLQRARFEFIEPVYIVRTLARKIPNDPYYSSSGSWGQPYDDLWGLKKMRLEEAWDRTTGSPDVTVAVVDTGVDYTHPDLKENIWQNPGETGLDANRRSKASNGLDDDNNGYIDDVRGAIWDDVGHGTHVAGIVAAVGNNNREITGVMWRGKIMSLLSMTTRTTDASASSSLHYAATNGARVINMSWGVSTPTQKLTDAIVYIRDQYPGTVLVAAAGNNCMAFNFYPAAYDNVVSVGASTPHDERAAFSTYGPTLDVVAPGGGWFADTTAIVNDRGFLPDCWGYYDEISNILSLRAQGTGLPVDRFQTEPRVIGESLIRHAGTSMAAPHAAGLAGLIASLHPDWTAAQIKQHIESTADDIGPARGRDDETGHGRINAARAINGGPPSPYVYIKDPQHGYTVPASGIVPIIGSVNDDRFLSFAVDIGQGWAPTQWMKLGSGLRSVTESKLAELDIGKLTSTGYHTIRVTALSASGTSTERRVIINRALPGDSNHDGVFNNADLVLVFQAGKYETGQTATFEAGDWNNDSLFNSGDIVAAVQANTYVNGAAALQANWQALTKPRSALPPAGSSSPSQAPTISADKPSATAPQPALALPAAVPNNPWQNQAKSADVNADGEVKITSDYYILGLAIPAWQKLAGTDQLDHDLSTPRAQTFFSQYKYVDVNGDFRLNVADRQAVVDYVRSGKY